MPFDLASAAVSILVLTPEGAGVDDSDLKAIALSLNGEIRQQLQNTNLITLSPYPSLDDLKAANNSAVTSMPYGSGKQTWQEQNRVDYVVTVTFVMKK